MIVRSSKDYFHTPAVSCRIGTIREIQWWTLAPATAGASARRWGHTLEQSAASCHVVCRCQNDLSFGNTKQLEEKSIWSTMIHLQFLSCLISGPIFSLQELDSLPDVCAVPENMASFPIGDDLISHRAYRWPKDFPMMGWPNTWDFSHIRHIKWLSSSIQSSYFQIGLLNQ